MASFGETLKRERELREISLRQIAEATKISIRYLEALEENRFDVLPGGLFNKGFIRAYSRFIGIDGEAMVNSYLQEMGPRTPGTAGSRPDANQASLHRPAEVPHKRAGARPGDSSSSQRPARPAITFAPSGASPASGQAGAGQPSAGPAAPGPPAAAASAGPTAESRSDGAPAPARADAPRKDSTRAAWEAITSDRIEPAERSKPRSSRALFWILSLVAAAGVLFLLMSVLRPAPPAASLPAGTSDGTESVGADAPAEGAEPAPQGAPEQPDGSSALLPEMSEPSHISLGALTTGAPAATPATDKPAAPGPASASRSEPASRPEATPRPGRDPIPPPLAGVASGPGERAGTLVPESGPMQVEILATDRTFVQVVCDGREVLNRVLEAGETEEARCAAVVRVSATDAGAARVTVNGSPCLPLGDPGTKTYGYTIRVDDYARICPRGERGSRGRR